MGIRIVWGSVLLLFAGAVNAQAGLLTAARETQLEAWLGMGELEFNEIYSKGWDHDSRKFHKQVDGVESTVTLMEIADVLEFGKGEIIGGYNPHPWTSPVGGAFNEPAIKDAFLFNLSTGLRLEQVGQYQTFNHMDYGPTFGGVGIPAVMSFDLYVRSDLQTGSMLRSAYGDVNLVGKTTKSEVTFGAIEVYTFVPANTAVSAPEPASLAVMGIGVVGMIAGGRGRRWLAKQTG